MKKIALTAAALMIATGSAFAGSGQTVVAPNSDYAASSTIDRTTTSSVVRDLIGSDRRENGQNQFLGDLNFKQGEYGQGLWGN